MRTIATPEAVLSGQTTDIYFVRTERVLDHCGLNPPVRAEIAARALPRGWPWALLAGIGEALELLLPLPVRVRALPEGSVFHPGEPVLEVEGGYRDFCRFETPLLGMLCQASGVATAAARFKALAQGRPVYSFGARRMHPALSPMIERAAYLGGCDGVSTLEAARLTGTDPAGTMPHALILCMGSTAKAFRAYDASMPPTAPRVALVDTFQDEKFEAVSLAETFGSTLDALRFDTPASRRGDFAALLSECRWELDLRGHRHIRFIVSGGLQERDLPALRPVADAFGVGSAISNAPVVDFSMDIVEVDGRPSAKRGKASGSKALLACASCGMRRVAPAAKAPMACPCGGSLADLLTPCCDHGARLTPDEAPAAVRDRAARALEGLEVTPLPAP